MPIYSIVSINKDGEQIKKSLTFDNEGELFEYLHVTNTQALHIKEEPSFYKYFNIKKLFSGITTQEIVEFLSNMQVVLRSGIPTNNGLFDLANDTNNPKLAAMLSDIAYRVQIGSSLSDAMAKYENIFGETIINLVRIGEETGSLDSTLGDAAAHLKKIADLKGKAKSAMIYPAFSFFALLGAMMFWLIAVMPQILETFDSFDMELPALTVYIQKVSAFLKSNILMIIVMIIALFIVFKVARKKSYNFRFRTDKIALKIPILGDLQAYFNYAFFAEYIRLMITAGLPLYQAMTIIGNSLTNTVFKRAVDNALAEIANGASFSQAIDNQRLFPPLVVRMIGVGEQSGQLEEQLGYITNYYYGKVDYIAQNIAKFIEPIIIVFVGLFMVVIMVGLLGPVYDLIGNVTKAGQ